MAMWNPWHGCHKLSSGCKNCYVYRGDARRGRDASIVQKTGSFYLPISHGRDGNYKYPPGTWFWTCFSSDFFVPDADGWREEAWRMMKTRADCKFFFITKRIDRFSSCIPKDWGAGYENVSVSCTVEDQRMADYRLPLFLAAPIRHKFLACEPLLEGVELAKYLDASICQLVAGGESGENARLCRYEWILSLRDQCQSKGVPFHFKQTGANFEKDGRIYHIPRPLQHKQARKANIDYRPPSSRLR